MRFRFVEEHRGRFAAKRLCEVVGVSSRGLRAFRSRPSSRRQRFDLITLAHIKEQSRRSLGSYGWESGFVAGSIFLHHQLDDKPPH